MHINDAHSSHVVISDREEQNTVKSTGQSSSTSLQSFGHDNVEAFAPTKSSLKQRWAILALACMVMLGLYYLLKMPASVHEQLKQTMPQEDFEHKYQLLYTSAQAPGIVLPVFTGVLVDKFGGRMCLLLLSITCLIGHIIVPFGIEAGSWSVVFIGRFVYGLGFEALFTTNQAFLVTWFGEKELGLALGISSAFSYLGFLLSFAISPVAANKVSTAFAFWVGTMIKSVSVAAAGCIFVLDRQTDQLVLQSQTQSYSSRAACIDEQIELESSVGQALSAASQHTTSTQASNEEEGMECKKIRLSNFSLSFWLICISCLLVYSVDRTSTDIASGLMLERNLFVVPPNDCKLQYSDQCSSGYLAPAMGNPPKDSNNMSCPENQPYISFAPPWPGSINVTKEEPLWGNASYIFDPLLKSDIDCNDDFWAEACTYDYCKEQEKATVTAGLLMTVPYLITIAMTFIFGHYGVDKFGCRAEMICFAPLLTAIGHAMMASQRTSLLPPLIMQGLGYSISLSALCPSVPLTVKSSVGTAFGLYTCIQNLGLVFVPLIVASIYNNRGQQYLPAVEILLIGLSVAGVLVGICLVFYDRKSGGRLRTRRLRSIEEEVQDSSVRESEHDNNLRACEL